MQEMLQPGQCGAGRGSASTSTLGVPHTGDTLRGTEEPGQALLHVWSAEKSHQLCKPSSLIQHFDSNYWMSICSYLLML